MSKKGKSAIQSYQQSYWSNREKTLCHLHTFLWLPVVLVTSEVMWENWLTQGGRRKRDPGCGILSRREEYMRIPQPGRQLEGGKIKAYRYMNCMEKMKGEWPLLCWGEDEIGKREMTLTSTSTSVERPASCASFTSVPNPVSCLWMMLAKNASSHKNTVGEQRNYIAETWKRIFK